MIRWRDHLVEDPQVQEGRLCARGTRVLVTTILDSLAEGASREEILASYPSLQSEHVDAAVAYAASLAHEKSRLAARRTARRHARERQPPVTAAEPRHGETRRDLRGFSLFDKAEQALQKAVAEAIAEHWRAGRPVYIWQDEQVVALYPDGRTEPVPKT